MAKKAKKKPATKAKAAVKKPTPKSKRARKLVPVVPKVQVRRVRPVKWVKAPVRSGYDLNREDL